MSACDCTQNAARALVDDIPNRRACVTGAKYYIGWVMVRKPSDQTPWEFRAAASRGALACSSPSSVLPLEFGTHHGRAEPILNGSALYVLPRASFPTASSEPSERRPHIPSQGCAQ